MTRPWSPGAATGLGSLPMTDPREAVRVVLGELPDLPHLPELPARGPGADLIGRGAAFLVELPVEIVPTGWRLSSRPGRDLRRARDFLSWDLDALEAEAADLAGPVKVQVAGPWTLAASLELPSGHRVVTDAGAVRELAQSLAEGLRLHVEDVRRRLPHATPVVQLDEPSLPAVLAGRLSTPSGYGTVRSVERSAAETVLHDVLSVADEGARVVHCCAPDVPVDLLRDAGANAVAVDAALIRKGELDQLGEAVDAGVSLWLGVVPGSDATIDYPDARDRVLEIWGTLGFARGQLAGAVVPTPACGLAGASTRYVRRALAVVRDVGRALVEA